MKRAVAVAAVFVAVLAGSRWFLTGGPDQRGFEFFSDMVRSAAYKSQSPNPWLPHGQTSQRPIPGTVPRDRLPLRFGPSEEESVRAGLELSSPLTEETLDLERGQAVYEVYCQTCHGAGGQGDGPVTRRGVPAPLPFSSDAARAMRDGQIFHIITFGYKNMPAYGPQLDRQDRWQVVHYVRRLEEGQQ